MSSRSDTRWVGTGGRSTMLARPIDLPSILALDLEDAAAAAVLLPAIEPFVDEVSFNGVTSQGPVAAYVGKLLTLLGRHDEAERRHLEALTMVEAFGWEYHRASTLIALAKNRVAVSGRLDAIAERWLA
ncbi:MAG: hypothetical protein ABI658_21185, partial [Acidimicrobiales bacterium]